ncbi:MAG: hypothetical protein ABSA92_04985 [Candidatus Bathyarchaeia archaeon]
MSEEENDTISSPHIDPFDTRHLIESVKSEFVSTYLKTASDALDKTQLTKTSQDLIEKVSAFLASYQKDLNSTVPILAKYKTYQRYARPPADYKDRYERTCFILPKPNELQEYQNAQGMMRAWLVASLMMKALFITEISRLLLGEIEKIPQDTGKEYKVTQGNLSVTQYVTLSTLEEVKDIIGVLGDAFREYLELKGKLLRHIGRLKAFRGSLIYPTHWDIELQRVRIDIVRGDDSAIYHIRTALELMLQITLRYFEDPLIEKYAKLVTTIRVAEACKRAKIDLPISTDLIERISYYSNLSLHRGHRIPFSDAWHMLYLLSEASKKFQTMTITSESADNLKKELKSILRIT